MTMAKRETRITFFLRVIGVISVAPIFVRAAQLLFLGGTALVQEATPDGAASSVARAVREPLFVALLPFIFSLIVLIGFAQKRPSWLWLGGIGLVVTGVMLLFSLGIYISLVGLFVLLLTAVLSKFTAYQA